MAKAKEKEVVKKKDGGGKKKASGPKVAKKKRQCSTGVAHVQATFNNTIITITDPSGATIAAASAGKGGFAGSRKSSAFAATVAAQDAGKSAVTGHGMKEIEVYIKGPGLGRESAIRGLASVGLHVTLIKDVTPVPHNGCRPPKRRRV